MNVNRAKLGKLSHVYLVCRQAHQSGGALGVEGHDHVQSLAFSAEMSSQLIRWLWMAPRRMDYHFQQINISKSRPVAHQKMNLRMANMSAAAAVNHREDAGPTLCFKIPNQLRIPVS